MYGKSIMHRLFALALTLLLLAAAFAVACGGDGERTVTIYSGRSEELVAPILDRFSEETGIEVQVRYGGTAELAALLLEEGDRSPADVFFAQDAGALGAVESDELFAELDEDVLARVEETLRAPSGRWVGVSGRARVVVYNTERLSPEDLPDSILDFTDPEWQGRIGWPPTNGSFQAFVTALRLVEGEAAARAWLEGIAANDPIVYGSNTPTVAAVAAGEVDVGFVNHYYLHRFLAEEGDGFGARNYYTAPGDVGTLINVAGVGILEAANHGDEAAELVEFLLSDEAQRYFADETFEYPVVASVPANADVRSIEDLQPLRLDLGRLEDLEATLALMRDVGVIE
jgi:iron(III) transport system substrate-binding protein